MATWSHFVSFSPLIFFIAYKDHFDLVRYEINSLPWTYSPTTLDDTIMMPFELSTSVDSMASVQEQITSSIVSKSTVQSEGSQQSYSPVVVGFVLFGFALFVYFLRKMERSNSKPTMANGNRIVTTVELPTVSTNLLNVQKRKSQYESII